jgi:hypothetical protein
MRMTSRKMLGGALVAFLAAGCDTAPPGAGLVNGDPATLKAEEKPAMRTDLPTPDLAGKDDALAEPAASSPAASGNNAQGETKPPGDINVGNPRSPQ